jgi:hypothetical protein
MGLLQAFSPFLAFLVGERHFGIVPALCAGAAVAVALVVHARLRGARETRVLEVGTAVLFGALALCAAFVTGIDWSIGLVRLVLDLGLMALVLAGIAAGKPFTLAFARAKVSAERAATPGFLRTNRLVSAAWAGAFLVLGCADVVLMLRPDWPLAVPIAIGAAGLLAALAVTRWLPARLARAA